MFMTLVLSKIGALLSIQFSLLKSCPLRTDGSHKCVMKKVIEISCFLNDFVCNKEVFSFHKTNNIAKFCPLSAFFITANFSVSKIAKLTNFQWSLKIGNPYLSPARIDLYFSNPYHVEVFFSRWIRLCYAFNLTWIIEDMI